MPTPILMPALSPTMEEGSLSKWSIKVGERISAGQVIAEIETDKATMEVEAVDEGIVVEILVPAGAENVKVNSPIAMLLQDDEQAGNNGARNDATPGANGAAERSPAATQTSAAKKAPASPKIEPRGVLSDANHEPRVSASPLAKRLAKMEGLDLRTIKGTGPHQRIVKRDIEAALGGREAAGAVSGSPRDASIKPVATITGVDARLYPPDSYKAIKLDGMRKVIAKRLTQSFNKEVPHFPLNIDIDLTNVLGVRAALNAAAPKDGDRAYKLSVNDFVIKASAMALMEAPNANASYTEEAILLHRHADIGVAVAVDGGLITPIVWKAELKGLRQISTEVKELAARAKARKLKPEEFQGGTFSVSNLGMFGITSFASIVNQPQGAILSVGAGEDRAVVRAGQIVVRTMMTVTLTCDHRVVDGAVGAAFLAALRKFLEEPAAMLL